MANLRSSLVINFFATTGATVIQFIVSVLLARILSPADIGIYSLTLVIINVAHIFRDFGIVTYLQREDSLTPEKMRSALGMLIASSWMVAAALFVGADRLAGLLYQPATSDVIRVLAAGFLLIPFGSYVQAILTRRFAATRQAVVIIAGTSAHAATGLSLGILGFGPMSLAWANFANIALSTLLYVLLAPEDISLRPTLRHYGGVFRFGIASLVSNLAESINEAMPDVLLGRFGSARQVGLYSRANSTVAIFSYVAGSTINYGSVSYASQKFHRGEGLDTFLRSATALLSGLAWPVLCATAFFGREILITLYGPAWEDAAAAIPFLCAASGISIAFNYVPAGVNAVGKPALTMLPILTLLTTRIGTVLALYDGSLRSFAIGLSIAAFAVVPVNLVIQQRVLGFAARDFFNSLLQSAICTACCALTSWILTRVISPDLPAILQLLLAAGPIALVWYASLEMTKHPLCEEISRLKSMFRSIRE